MSSSHFDAIAAVYDESLPAHVVEHYLRKRTRFVVEHCPRGQGARRRLRDRRARGAARATPATTMTGVDPSAGMLEILRARAPDVEAVEASGTALPFDDDSFDLVLSVAVMHHIADPGDVRRDARRDGPRRAARAAGSSSGTTTRATRTGAA